MFDTVVHRWLRVPYALHVTEFHFPKKPRETIVFIHGLGDSAESWRGVAEKLPEDVRVIAVDMLGFGKSPKPKWVRYDIAVQARAIAHTLVRMRLLQRPIVVGHSMGSLVAIELARRFPLVLKQLVLCSPPLYKSTTEEWVGREKMLKDFYKLVTKHPSELEKIAPLARNLGITTDVFNVWGENAAVYVAALESSIINQSSLDDVRKLHLPINVLYGVFDPVVIGSYLKQLGREMDNVVVKQLPVGHEIVGPYTGFIVSAIRNLTVSKS